MPRPSSYQSFVFLSGTGCLLPALVVFNLFFGWLFLRPAAWVMVEAALLLLLLVYTHFLRRKITRLQQKRDNVIDTDAEIIE